MQLEERIISNYRLLRLLGKGGFAEVWLGEHIHLGTYAALKILQPLDAGSQAMFLQEGKTIAKLRHENIVRLLDYTLVDIDGKVIPVLIMDYAKDGSLRGRHPKGQAIPLEVVLAYLNQIAPTLDYVHQVGKIVHRDIKPDNMLIEGDRILLSDFGIIASIHSAQSLQTTGSSFAGTMSYVAPEQIDGKPVPASDQYALGIVIYEWLCGRVPFAGTYWEIAEKHKNGIPEPLYERCNVTRQVDDVVMTMLYKHPNNRFANIRQALANLWMAYSDIPLADNALVGTPPVPEISSTPPDIRNIYTYTEHKGYVKAVAWSPDGTRIASGGGDSMVRIWNSTGSNLLYNRHTGMVSSVAWSPDGKQIASGSNDKHVHVWNATDGQIVRDYSWRLSEVTAVAWSPDGMYTLCGSTTKGYHIFGATDRKDDIRTGGDTRLIVLSVAWSPDGKFIALGLNDGAVSVFPAAPRPSVTIFKAMRNSFLGIRSEGFHAIKHRRAVNSIAWSPDGTLIASGGDDNTVNIFSAIDGTTTHVYPGHQREVKSVAWSPDGTRIASGGMCGFLVWNAADGSNTETYREHTDWVNSVAWSPDGKYLASASNDCTVRIWAVS